MPFASSRDAGSLGGQAVWMWSWALADEPSPRALGRARGCTLEDTKEKDLVELITPGSTPGRVWVSSQRAFQVSGLNFSQNLYYPGLFPTTIIYCNLAFIHLIMLFVHLSWIPLVNRVLTGQASIVPFNLVNFQLALQRHFLSLGFVMKHNRWLLYQGTWPLGEHTKMLICRQTTPNTSLKAPVVLRFTSTHYRATQKLSNQIFKGKLSLSCIRISRNSPPIWTLKNRNWVFLSILRACRSYLFGHRHKHI